MSVVGELDIIRNYSKVNLSPMQIGYAQYEVLSIMLSQAVSG